MTHEQRALAKHAQKIQAVLDRYPEGISPKPYRRPVQRPVAKPEPIRHGQDVVSRRRGCKPSSMLVRSLATTA